MSTTSIIARRQINFDDVVQDGSQTINGLLCLYNNTFSITERHTTNDHSSTAQTTALQKDWPHYVDAPHCGRVAYIQHFKWNTSCFFMYDMTQHLQTSYILLVCWLIYVVFVWMWLYSLPLSWKSKRPVVLSIYMGLVDLISRWKRGCPLCDVTTGDLS